MVFVGLLFDKESGIGEPTYPRREKYAIQGFSGM
jgi:hypothetical protein